MRGKDDRSEILFSYIPRGAGRRAVKAPTGGRVSIFHAVEGSHHEKRGGLEKPPRRKPIMSTC
jgi:hypothetical protein